MQNMMEKKYILCSMLVEWTIQHSNMEAATTVSRYNPGREGRVQKLMGFVMQQLKGEAFRMRCFSLVFTGIRSIFTVILQCSICKSHKNPRITWLLQMFFYSSWLKKKIKSSYIPFCFSVRNHASSLSMNFNHYFREQSDSVFPSCITNVSFSVLNKILVKCIWIMIL